MLELVIAIFPLIAFLVAIGYVIFAVRNGYRYVLGFISVGMLCCARLFFEAYSLIDDNAARTFLFFFLAIGIPFATIGAFIALLVALRS
jgi:hypothetical protein